MYSYCSSVHPFLLRSVESSCGHLGTRRGTQSAGLRSIHQAYLGSAANETMNSVMEWLRPVMMSLLSAIEIYRNVMKWWWFILKPWVFPCRFTTPKKFPLTGDWVELGRAKHPPVFDRARTTHRKYQRFGRPLLEDGCVVDMSATSLLQPWSFLNKLYPLRLSTNASTVSSDPSDWRHGSSPS